MHIQDIYVKTYYRIVGHSICLRPIRLIVRSLANLHLKYAFRFKRDKYHCIDKEENVIVSLTSFPTRIDYLWIVIESLLRQTVKPRKIIVWLSEDQFKTVDIIPDSLKCMEKRGVEIRLVNGDIRSHKKYYYVFKECPNGKILLADDDIIYPSDMIETLLSYYNNSPHTKKVAHMYGYMMKYDQEGVLKPYNSWGTLYTQCESRNLFFGSGGGTLLKPSDLYQDVTNIELARLLAPQADDVWLNAMARMSGCVYLKVNNGPILTIQNSKDTPLYKSNMRECQNDVQIKAVRDYYISNKGIDPFAKYD